MDPRSATLGLLAAGAIAAGSVAMASPAWTAGAGHTTVATTACRLDAKVPSANRSKVTGYGSRRGCSDTVTYLWVRVYKAIDWWPDSEVAVKGQNYVQNGNLTSTGDCTDRGDYYTQTSTATGASGDSVESGRVVLC
jgi:hypothetical protein